MCKYMTYQRQRERGAGLEHAPLPGGERVHLLRYQQARDQAPVRQHSPGSGL